MTDLPEGVLTIGERLGELAGQHPDATAIVFSSATGERDVTWRQLDDLATRLAHRLLARGAEMGQYVAAAVPNSPELVALGFATWRAGGCFLPLSATQPSHELSGLLELADAAVTILAEPRPGVDAVTLAELLEEAAGAPTAPPPTVLAHPGKAIGSGGSTGRSKLIVTPTPLVWHEVLLNHPAFRSMGMPPGLKHLISGPLYHNFSFDQAFVTLFRGGSLVLMEAFDAVRAVDLVRRHRVDYLPVVPTTLRRILDVPELDPAAFESVVGVLHTAAPCPPALKRRAIDFFGAERVYEVYGATESFGMTVVRGDEWLAHPGTVGRPVGSRTLVLDEEGQAVRPGEVGTIWLRMDDSTVHARYDGAPPAPRTADGFETVGDLGWVDEDGFLYIADRRNDLVISGGVNVYPAEVEAVLAEHPAVAEAAVIGLRDEDWGQRVHAVVELRAQASASPEELRAFCAERLARPKVPKTVELVERLPRTESGKLRRSQLRADRETAVGHALNRPQ